MSTTNGTTAKSPPTSALAWRATAAELRSISDHYFREAAVHYRAAETEDSAGRGVVAGWFREIAYTLHSAGNKASQAAELAVSYADDAAGAT